jgi:predicted DNA-binding transcriptional regulator YafY
MNRTDRLYAIVEELRAAAPRPRTVAQLAGRFEVTERTIRRDLMALQESGVPCWSQPGPGGGYTIDAAMTLPPINLTAAEAMAIAVALTQATTLPFALSARSAMNKIATALSEETVAQVRAVASRIRAVGARDPDTLRELLGQALLDNKVMEIGYLDRSGEQTTRAVEPHSLVSGRDTWYLMAWCRLRDAGRGFRLDRITSVTTTGESCPVREFDDVAPDLATLARIPAVLEGLHTKDARR